MIYIYCLIVIAIIANIVLLTIFHKAPQRNKQQIYDTCIILGCPTREDGHISRMQKSRMNIAIQLYYEKKTKTLLISGAGVRNNFIEAQVMASYALKKGVKKHDIFIEMNARNTFDNLRYAQTICNEQQFQTILVITSRFHVRRSDFFVRKFFKDYAFDAPKEHEKLKHYLAEYIRMWNSLRYEIKYRRLNK